MREGRGQAHADGRPCEDTGRRRRPHTKQRDQPAHPVRLQPRTRMRVAFDEHWGLRHSCRGRAAPPSPAPRPSPSPGSELHRRPLTFRVLGGAQPGATADLSLGSRWAVGLRSRVGGHLGARLPPGLGIPPAVRAGTHSPVCPHLSPPSHLHQDDRADLLGRRHAVRPPRRLPSRGRALPCRPALPASPSCGGSCPDSGGPCT